MKNLANIKLDPRTYMIITMIGSIYMFALNDIGFYIFFAIVTIIFSFHKKLGILRFILSYSMLSMLKYIFMTYFSTEISVYFTLFIYIMQRMYPIFMLGIIVIHLSPGKIIASFRKMKLSEQIVMPLTVAMRFLPTIMQDFSDIRKAAKIRSINLTIWHPIRSYEYLLMPILLRSLTTADELSASIMTKGISYDCVKTSYHQIKFQPIDLIIIFCSVIFPLGGML